MAKRSPLIDCDHVSYFLSVVLLLALLPGSLVAQPRSDPNVGNVVAASGASVTQPIVLEDASGDFAMAGFDLLVENSQSDCCCDLNLNGTPAEIGDAMVYRNYFLRGLAAFDIAVDAQIAQSDCNSDGLSLTVADYVYLLRMLDGDLLYSTGPVSPLPSEKR